MVLRETQSELFSLADDVQKLVLGQQVKKRTAPRVHACWRCQNDQVFSPRMYSTVLCAYVYVGVYNFLCNLVALELRSRRGCCRTWREA